MTLLGKWLAADCGKMAAKNASPVLLALQVLTLHAHEFSEELRTESDIDLCLWAWLVDETLRQVERGVQYVPDDMADGFRQMLQGVEAGCDGSAPGEEQRRTTQGGFVDPRSTRSVARTHFGRRQ